MVTAQAIPHFAYTLYALFDHVSREYVASPSGNQLWERAELFDALTRFPKLSITIWNGFVFNNEVV
jgi:hypothetical protein